ncbi:transcription termination/antitermination protein NusA [Boudabousia liubingyangii]|uniref:Transcription termination/antitermination protein NusA n=1 Tax=Boudabousia liubingyangii TaxID=1921764 RepID=A0A1Q5PMY5_9ACTO|nr:transcription termination factor NusA [Boudabousia liubingyangii]OKL47492.1 transcription termination/antitermination protein NusA [Boudabousia liubingyangii]OKL48914.1 transcription termination/antitermination protein NusA [Boudabousia liubingyangii]
MEIDMKALRMVESEKGVSMDTLVDAIRVALLKAYHNMPGAIRDARVDIDEKTGQVSVLATEIDEEGNPIGEFDDTPAGFGRIATATVRSVIVQRLREAQDAEVLGAFKDKAGTVISGIVQQGRDPRVLKVDIGEFEAVLPESEQVPGEHLKHGQWIRAYVVEVARTERGPRVLLSRTHPGLVKGVFAREVPEIEKGDVVIESVAREAGHRSKIAVRATVKDLNAKGACIGPMGQRVRAVMNELGGEKIDIIDFSVEPEEYIANALSPARVSTIEIIDYDEKLARVVVPDFQLSLAIGKEGQNARLAARLTGWKIDIHSDAEEGLE